MQFIDSKGRDWVVREVKDPNIAMIPPPLTQPDFARGWLLFETLGEKRRLAPYPNDWGHLSSHSSRIVPAREPCRPGARELLLLRRWPAPSRLAASRGAARPFRNSCVRSRTPPLPCRRPRYIIEARGSSGSGRRRTPVRPRRRIRAYSPPCRHDGLTMSRASAILATALPLGCSVPARMPRCPAPSGGVRERHRRPHGPRARDRGADGDRARRSHCVGRAIGPARIPSGATRIDGRGKYLMPGLAEMHAHIPGGNAPEQTVRDIFALYIANGITTIRGMLGAPNQLTLRAKTASGEMLGPTIFVGAPSLNGNSAADPATAARLVREHKAAGYDFLKLHPGIPRSRTIRSWPLRGPRASPSPVTSRRALGSSILSRTGSPPSITWTATSRQRYRRQRARA